MYIPDVSSTVSFSLHSHRLCSVASFSTTCEESCQNWGWHHTWRCYIFFSLSWQFKLCISASHTFFWWADPLVIITELQFVCYLVSTLEKKKTLFTCSRELISHVNSNRWMNYFRSNKPLCDGDGDAAGTFFAATMFMQCYKISQYSTFLQTYAPMYFCFCCTLVANLVIV